MSLKIPCDDHLTAELWDGLIEIGGEMPREWTLIGARQNVEWIGTTVLQNLSHASDTVIGR